MRSDECLYKVMHPDKHVALCMHSGELTPIYPEWIYRSLEYTYRIMIYKTVNTHKLRVPRSLEIVNIFFTSILIVINTPIRHGELDTEEFKFNSLKWRHN